MRIARRVMLLLAAGLLTVTISCSKPAEPPSGTGSKPTENAPTADLSKADGGATDESADSKPDNSTAKPTPPPASSDSRNTAKPDSEQPMNVTSEPFGITSAGEPVEIFTLSGSHGIKAKVITYGAALVSLELPDREGKLENVVLTYDSLPGFEAGSSYFGATVGRYGNRIALGKFTLDGEQYELATNNGANHLHGGDVGFNRRIWKAEVLEGDDASVKFYYESPDGEEGYPGTLRAVITYTLTNNHELRIDYGATTDKKTHVNLTHHSYFNLAGHDSGNVLGHELMLACDHYLPVDDINNLIPTGEISPVEGTPMDFTKPKLIGADIGKQEGLYDHCFVVRKSDDALALVARVREPSSGRIMEIFSTEPGVQFYTANHLDGENEKGPAGTPYRKHQGLCLETQHYPDSPNQADFPTTILEPGQTYTSTTVHRFSVK